MKPVLVTNWITIRCGSSVLSFTQDEEEWLDLKSYQDCGFLIDVADVNVGTSDTVVLHLETSPTVDEGLFQGVCPPITLAASSTVTTVKSVRTPSTLALARWLRWRLVASTASAWSVTFRIRAIPVKSRFFVPTDIASCQTWHRADLGVTLDAGGGSGVMTWADQSGNNDTARDFQQATSAQQPTRTLVDSGYNNTSTLSFVALPSVQGMRTGTWTPPDSGTIFIVGNSDGAGVGNNRTFFDGTTIDPYLFRGTSGTGVDFTRMATISATVSTTGSKHVYCVELNGATSRLYQDSVTALATGDPGASAPTSVSIGFDSGNANSLMGKIAEMITYTDVLSPENRTCVMRYLGARYGIRITA